jgi:hypothetical protein
MADNTTNNAPNPELVEAMRARVVRRKPMDYGKRSGGTGRPPGREKTGGRRAGTPNLWTPAFREHLAARAKVFELLADVCSGRKIFDGEEKRKPNLSERLRAAETLVRKLMPDAASVHVSAQADHDPTTPSSKIDLARMIAFAMNEGLKELDTLEGEAIEQKGPAPSIAIESVETTPETTVDPDAAEEAGASSGRVPGGFAPDVGREETFHGHILRFEEHLSGGRERWSIRDAEGRFLAVAVGRDRAQGKALELGGIS